MLGSVRANRLTTIVGPGGAGKTRLAIEAAAAAGWRTARRRWLVELAPVTDPADIPQAVLGALGLRDARLPNAPTGRAPTPIEPTVDALGDAATACWCSTTAST